MPGLCGVASFESGDDLRESFDCLRAGHAAHPYKHDLRLDRAGCRAMAGAMSGTFALVSGRDHAGPVSIALEGWIGGIDGCDVCLTSAASLHDCLVMLYRREGSAFVDRLHGSFTLMVADTARQQVILAADHSASRPLFWTLRDGHLLWASELSALFNLPHMNWDLSPAAVANFLSCGHHLGSGTWLRDVQQIPPGQGVVWSPAGMQHYTYFEYRPGAEANPRANADELADTLAEAVLRSTERCLRVSPAPVVTLSGGLDSRLVLGALIENGAAGIRTTTWGCENDYVHGDAGVASRLAAALGLEHRFMQRRDDYLSLPEFTRLFGAETDAVTYHLGETDVLDRMLAQGWSRWLYRGDECFGWLGDVSSPEEALAAIGVRPFIALNSGLASILHDDARESMVSDQGAFLERITDSSAPGSPADLKDRFYLEHRLARYLHPSSYYKLSRVEIFNPLLGKEVLGLLRYVPAHLRLYKRLEHILMEKRFSRLMRVPLASRASIPDATRCWREEPALRAFMGKTLSQEGRVWSRLVRFDRVRDLMARTLVSPGREAGRFRHLCGRVLRTAGLYEQYKRRTWRPLNHARPSAIQILQRLLAMRLWLLPHEERLRLEF